MRFVLASHNKGKLAEMQAILGELGVEVVIPSDVGVDVDVEETGTTFAENAALKANAVMAASGLPAIADDSGLCVDWLQGAPGVYSARYGGLDSDPERCRLLLSNMRGATNRAAHFHTGHRLRLPQRGHADGGGGLRRDHCLCAYGRRRVWVRPCVLRAVPAKDLRPADGGGEERHFPPGQCPAGLCRGTENVFGEAMIWN